MGRLRRPLLAAAVVAIPIELVNYFVFPFPVDVGLPDDATWWQQALGGEWVILHLPGLRLWDWLYHAGHAGMFPLVVFASGYVDTVLLLLLSIYAVRGIRAIAGRYRARTS